jgi:hypothetical protein
MIPVEPIEVRPTGSLPKDDALPDEMRERAAYAAVGSPSRRLDRTAGERVLAAREKGEDVTVERRRYDLKGTLQIHAAQDSRIGLDIAHMGAI